MRRFLDLFLMQNSRRKRLALIFIIGVLALVALYYIPTGYVLTAPGPTRDLSKVVEVQDAHPSQGLFLLTTATSRNANPLLHLYGIISPRMDLIPERYVILPDQDPSEYWEFQRHLMMESQEAAKVAALRQLGYDARLVGTGVRVVGVFDDAPAHGLLHKGDVVLAVEGSSVSFASDLVTRISQVPPGEYVRLKVERMGEEVDLEVPTTFNRDQERTIIGVLVETAGFHAEIPVDISIDISDVSGSSAGLMFSLEIINQLTEGDLTHGFIVAGTGTIESDGSVGPIGAVRQKVFGAERSGADIFLVPRQNVDEALRAASSIRVFPVTSLEDALEVLAGLGQG